MGRQVLVWPCDTAPAWLLRELKKLCEVADDTLMVIASELWMADISFYQAVKQAARRNVLGARYRLRRPQAALPWTRRRPCSPRRWR